MIPENAPQWLKDAKTEYANVEIIDSYPYVIWHDGVWRGGVWLGGGWRGGEWRGGEWRGGVWRGGVWLGGAYAPKSKWFITVNDTGDITIGCKTMSIPEWDAWFAGNEEFETKRGTKEFQMIQAHYEAVKAYYNFMTKGRSGQ